MLCELHPTNRNKYKRMNKLKTNPYRLVPQIAIIALLIYAGIRTLISNQYVADFEAYCPFGGIQAYASFLFNNSLACNMTNVQISMGLFLVIAVVVFSKLFCSVISLDILMTV